MSIYHMSNNLPENLIGFECLLHVSFLAVSFRVFILMHHEKYFAEDLMGGSLLFALILRCLEHTWKFTETSESASGIHQSKQSSLNSQMHRVLYASSTEEVATRNGLMKMKKLNLKIKAITTECHNSSHTFCLVKVMRF